MYPPPAPVTRTPGTVVALRILAWIEVLFLLLGVGLAGAIAVASGSALSSSDDELTQGFAGLGLFLGLVLAAFWLVLVALVAVPTALLRTGRRSRKLGSLITLTVVQSLFALVLLLVAINALSTSQPEQAVWPVVIALPPIAVIVLAMLPASRTWAANAPATAWNGPPPGSYPGPPAPYGAPPPPTPYGTPPPPVW